MPTDILGLTPATYDEHKRSIGSAIGPAVNKIRKSIDALSTKSDLNPPISYYDFRNLPSYSDEISSSSRRIFMLSLRAGGFIEDHENDGGERLLQSLKNGTKIKILLFDPYIKLEQAQGGHLEKSGEILSVFSGSGCSQSAWAEALERSLEFLRTIRTRAVEMKCKGSIEAKFHCSPVVSMLFFIDDTLYFGPYFMQSSSNKSPTFKIDSQHQLFNRFLNHFNKLWGEPRLTTDIEGLSAIPPTG